MKGIKLRVWSKSSKKMYFQLNESPCFGLFEGDRAVSIEDVFYYEKQDFELIQYTGLNDNNEKEIYEGDILSVDYGDRIENHEVTWGKWDDGEYLFNCECWMVDGIPLSDIHNKTWGHAKADVKVIGNIYENPELLEKY